MPPEGVAPARTTPRSVIGSVEPSCCTVNHGAEVVRDRVEAAGVHDPGAGRDGAVVVREVHPVDELRLAGQVHVVGAGLGAGGDQRLAVQQVGTDRGDHDPGRLGDRAQRGVVGAVGLQQRQLGERRVDASPAGAHRLELALVAPGQRPAQAGGGVLGEVGGGELAGEAGGSEDDDVVVCGSRVCLRVGTIGASTAERCTAVQSAPSSLIGTSRGTEHASRKAHRDDGRDHRGIGVGAGRSLRWRGGTRTSRDHDPRSALDATRVCCRRSTRPCGRPFAAATTCAPGTSTTPSTWSDPTAGRQRADLLRLATARDRRTRVVVRPGRPRPTRHGASVSAPARTPRRRGSTSPTSPRPTGGSSYASTTTGCVVTDVERRRAAPSWRRGRCPRDDTPTGCCSSGRPRCVVLGQESRQLRRRGRRRVLADGPDVGGHRTELDLDISDPSSPTVTDQRSYDARLTSARQHGDVVRLVLGSGLPDLDFVEPWGFRTEKGAEERNREIVSKSTIEDWVPGVTTDGGSTQLADCERRQRPRPRLRRPAVSTWSASTRTRRPRRRSPGSRRTPTSPTRPRTGSTWPPAGLSPSGAAS